MLKDDLCVEMCRQWPQLRAISLVGRDNSLSERSVRALSSVNKRLDRVDLSGVSTCLSSESLMGFHGFKLRRLDVTMCKHISRECLLYVLSPPPGKVSPLDCLELGGLDFGDGIVSEIVKTCPRITKIDLHLWPSLSDVSLYILSESLPCLSDLSLGGCYEVTDEGITSVVNHCRSLTRIVLRSCDNITDRSVRTLARLPCLSHLNLRGCYLVTENGIAFIIEVSTTLQHINLTACTLLNTETVERLALAQQDRGSTTLAVRGPQAGEYREFRGWQDVCLNAG